MADNEELVDYDEEEVRACQKTTRLDQTRGGSFPQFWLDHIFPAIGFWPKTFYCLLLLH